VSNDRAPCQAAAVQQSSGVRDRKPSQDVQPSVDGIRKVGSLALVITLQNWMGRCFCCVKER
jgi:hypothetical protein